MDPLGAEAIDEAIRQQHGEHARLDPSEPQCGVVAFDQLEDRRELPAPCESMKFTPSRSRTTARSGSDPSCVSARTRSSSAWLVAKNRPLSRPQHDDAGE